MLRSRTLLIQFAIFICVLLIGCSTSNGSKLNVSTDLAKSPYTDEQLLEIAGFTGSIKEITNSYKTNYIKKTANVHFVVFRGETTILLLTFDSSGNKVLESFHNMAVAKSAFDMISVGSKLSDVQMIDPVAEIPLDDYSRHGIYVVAQLYEKCTRVLTFQEQDGMVSDLSLRKYQQAYYEAVRDLGLEAVYGDGCV